MSKASSSKKPIRLFKSDFLEFFTHINPMVVLIIWLPVTGYFLYRALSTRPAGISALYIPIFFGVGLFVWTLAEYSLHRFVFHFKPRTPWQERLSFLFHGVHHAQPMSKSRLVMPPAVSIPLAGLFYVGFWGVLGQVLGKGHWIAPLFSGFIFGYLAYDMLHYSIHHFRIRGGYLQQVRLHHMRHHGATPDIRFGITTRLWDRAFGTFPGED
ncbi:MAG: sterol desaturase family protein [Anaerolineae bacterium]